MSSDPGSPYDAAFYEEIRAGSLRSARVVLPLLFDVIGPRSVLDVGCGTGTWLAVCAELGATDLLGVDADHVDQRRLEIPAERFVAADLERPLDLGREFDLVMSLEVAEHLDAASADEFVGGLARHGEVILFSAAIPEQGGAHHVNEQWPAYWASRFARHSLAAADLLRPQVWLDDAVEPWYAQNALVFATERALGRWPALAAAVPLGGAPLPLVHPRIYDWHAHWSPKGYDHHAPGPAED